MKRPLLLSGFMATGKSTVGKIVAELAKARFFDLDAEIERRAGKTIATIFAEEGEAHFRALESETLKELLRTEGPDLVMSLGGGALLNRATRIEALFSTVVVTLQASEAEILRRARLSRLEDRPLLNQPDPEGVIRRLLGERALAYAEAHAQVQTDGRSAREIAEEVLQIAERDEIVVAAGSASYCVSVGAGKIESQLARVLPDNSGVLLVSDENVSPLYAEGVHAALPEGTLNKGQVNLVPGEEHKHLQALSAIFEQAFSSRLDRKGLLIGLGGGVTTDMTGFAAASWVRGIRWVGLPTTLLAMVDASTGGKTGVDFHTAKNAVGAFWQPSAVICDVKTLQTETERAYLGALSEVVKTALIGDASLLDFLEENVEAIRARDLSTMTHVVDACIRVKARVVSLDEREGGIRAFLNLGHTIGHALESSGGYSELTHGEAVALGLVAALRLGERLGHTPPELTSRTCELMKRLGLPTVLLRERLVQATELLGLDKKRAGSQIRFIFARAAGDVFAVNVPLAQLEEVAVQLADESCA